MARCTGIRCQMQANYKVDECDYKDCPHRTEPMTNADKIRAMSDEELSKFLREPFCDNRTYDECTISYCGVCDQCVLDWLQQPSEAEE